MCSPGDQLEAQAFLARLKRLRARAERDPQLALKLLQVLAPDEYGACGCTTMAELMDLELEGVDGPAAGERACT